MTLSHELAAREDHYRSLVQSSYDVIMITDVDGVVRHLDQLRRPAGVADHLGGLFGAFAFGLSFKVREMAHIASMRADIVTCRVLLHHCYQDPSL